MHDLTQRLYDQDDEQVDDIHQSKIKDHKWRDHHPLIECQQTRVVLSLVATIPFPFKQEVYDRHIAYHQGTNEADHGDRLPSEMPTAHQAIQEDKVECKIKKRQKLNYNLYQHIDKAQSATLS